MPQPKVTQEQMNAARQRLIDARRTATNQYFQDQSTEKQNKLTKQNLDNKKTQKEIDKLSKEQNDIANGDYVTTPAKNYPLDVNSELPVKVKLDAVPEKDAVVAKRMLLKRFLEYKPDRYLNMSAPDVMNELQNNSNQAVADYTNSEDGKQRTQMILDAMRKQFKVKPSTTTSKPKVDVQNLTGDLNE